MTKRATEILNFSPPIQIGVGNIIHNQRQLLSQETSEYENFVEIQESERLKLENLKVEISNIFPHSQVFHYSPKASFSEENNEVIMEGLEIICSATINFFKSRIQQTFFGNKDHCSMNPEGCSDMKATLKFISKDVSGRSKEVEDLRYFLENPMTSLPILNEEHFYEELAQVG